MNTNFPQDGDLPPVDKTIVEGPDAVQQPRQLPPQPLQPRTDLTPGARTTISAVRTTVGRPRSDGGSLRLPEEGESVPMGSGTTVSVLGTGGMARVYKVWNDKLEVHRAVKVMLPTDNKDMLKRFETEVKISAKLRHPNIVEIHSVGEWQGLPYIEMELIEGESLEAIINRQGRLPDTLVAAVAIFIARALAYAHTQKLLIYGKTYHGLIHRDLKPANIMIAKTGDVKLMDFGIARPTETSLHTVAGNIVGTLPYLAPEQIDGDTSEMDNRVDIYACGTILYEMLTGTKTFPQNTITNLMKSKITNQYRRFEEFGFGVSPTMAKIAQKCLQVSKEDRFATSAEFLAALEAAFRKMSDDPPERVVQAFLNAPESVQTSAPRHGQGKPAYLKPIVLIPAGAVVALAALVVVLLLTGPKQKSPAPAAARPPAAAPAPAPAPSPAPAVPEENLKPLGEAPVSQAQSVPTPGPRPEAQPARPAPVTAAATERKTPPRETPKPAVKKPAASPLDQLKQTHGSEDAFTAGQAAFQKRQYADAITLLQSSPQSSKRDIMLLEAMVESGRLGDAVDMTEGSTIKDAQFELSAGKAFYKTKNYTEALRRFEASMQRPSEMRSRQEILKDALYYIALVRTAQYRQNSSSDNKQLAYDAWFKVKQMIRDTSDYRLKRAREDLASIK